MIYIPECYIDIWHARHIARLLGNERRVLKLNMVFLISPELRDMPYAFAKAMVEEIM